MAVRVADSLKQQNDLKTFPVAYSEDIWLDENKGEGDANFKDLQTLYNENKLGGSGLPEPESADKVLLSASSNTRADGLEWKQVSKNDVGLQLPEFESLEEWDSLPADEKSKYYNAGKGYVVIKEDVKGAKGVIDDTKPTSTVTTLSAKKIGDSLVSALEDKADKTLQLPSSTGSTIKDFLAELTYRVVEKDIPQKEKFTFYSAWTGKESVSGTVIRLADDVYEFEAYMEKSGAYIINYTRNVVRNIYELATMDKVTGKFAKILNNSDSNVEEAVMIGYMGSPINAIRFYRDDVEHELQFDRNGISYRINNQLIWSK